MMVCPVRAENNLKFAAQTRKTALTINYQE